MTLLKRLFLACLLFSYAIPTLSAAPRNPHVPKKIRERQNKHRSTTRHTKEIKPSQDNTFRGIINVPDKQGNMIQLEWYKLKNDPFSQELLKLARSIYAEADIAESEQYKDFYSDKKTNSSSSLCNHIEPIKSTKEYL